MATLLSDKWSDEPKKAIRLTSDSNRAPAVKFIAKMQILIDKQSNLEKQISTIVAKEGGGGAERKEN